MSLGFPMIPSPNTTRHSGFFRKKTGAPKHPQNLQHPASSRGKSDRAFRSVNSTDSPTMFRGPDAPARCSSNSAMPVVSGMPKSRLNRKVFPGESKGITEEMRFVALRLRKTKTDDDSSTHGHNGESWKPAMRGFLQYLVDSKLVFNTIERVVLESSRFPYDDFRRTGLERSSRLSRDLERLGRRGMDLPRPGPPGVSYAGYLEKLAVDSAPFLCHFYNIYFSHLAGGQVIAKQAGDELLNGKGLEFCRWGGDVEVLLKGVREKLTVLSQKWSRKQKNKCLKETSKSLHYMGQIIRLIILRNAIKF